MKRNIALILVLCMMLALLSACGSKDTAGKSAVDVPPTSDIKADVEEKADSTSAAPADNPAQEARQPAADEAPAAQPAEEEEKTFDAPDIEDIRSIGYEEIIQLPEEESYLSSREKMFVTVPSASVFSKSQSGKSVAIGSVKHGDEVTVIAKQKSVACILCSIDGEDAAGWITQNSLGYNDTKANQKNASAPEHAGRPGIKAIRNCGQEKSITLPEENDYISCFDRMYVSQNAVNALSSIEKNASITECHLLIGDEVNVIAVKDNLACILMNTDCGEKAGWVYREQLSYNDPRKDPKPVKAADHSGTPGISVLENMGLEKNLTLPEDESYTAVFDRMYTVPNVVQVFSVNTKKLSVVECVLVSGSEVNVIAIQDKIALILFQTDNGEKAGWIALSALSYHNPKNDNDPTFTKEYTGVPGVRDIEKLGLQNSMTLPLDESYISSYDRMYVVPNNIKVFSFREKDFSNEICTLASGSEVSIIALQEKYACILFETDEGTKCGWISQDSLFYNNPKNKPAAVKAVPHSGKPGIKILEDLGLDRSVKLPDEENYTSSFDRMYNSVSSLQVFSQTDSKLRNISFTLLKGTEVNVIAIQDKYALILAQTDEGEKAGWVVLESLLYNNPDVKPKPSAVASFSGTPSVKTIEDLGLDRSVTLPDDDAYLPVFDNMYVQIASMQVLSFYEKGFSNVCCSIPSGSEVSVIAISKTAACILFETDEGTKCGWTLLQNLSYNDPKKTVKPTEVSMPSGSPGEKDIENLGMEKSMTLPDPDSYLDSYKVLKTLSNAGVSCFNGKTGSIQSCALAKGSTVVQIAKQKGYACILCNTDQGVKAAWVLETMLKED